MEALFLGHRMMLSLFVVFALIAFSKAKLLPYSGRLAIREKALGLEHDDVAQSLNNLATLYHNQGRCF
jgi:hypothetical protein